MRKRWNEPINGRRPEKKNESICFFVSTKAKRVPSRHQDFFFRFALSLARVSLFSLNISFAFNGVINIARCAFAQRVIVLVRNQKAKKVDNKKIIITIEIRLFLFGAFSVFFLFFSFGSRVQHQNREIRVQTHISDVCMVSDAVLFDFYFFLFFQCAPVVGVNVLKFFFRSNLLNERKLWGILRNFLS